MRISQNICLPFVSIIQTENRLGERPPTQTRHDRNHIFSDGRPCFFKLTDVPIHIFKSKNCIDDRSGESKNISSQNRLNKINKSTGLFVSILLRVSIRYVYIDKRPLGSDVGFSTRQCSVEIYSPNIHSSFFIKGDSVILKFIEDTAHVGKAKLTNFSIFHSHLGCDQRLPV